MLGQKVIFERSVKGRIGYRIPESEVPKVDLSNFIGEEQVRQLPPNLPEVNELDVLRHYTDLSRKNYGIETDMYPLGSCTMKYNPKINEDIAAFEGFKDIHPKWQVERVQGALELMFELKAYLREITGMDEISLQPAAGSHGELTGLMIIKAYLKKHGLEHKHKIIIPDSAHGTNPASVSMVGFDVIEVKSNQQGIIESDAIAKVLDDEVAGLMLTNPNTLGMFESDILSIIELVHEYGGLAYYDGANMNANLGITRPGDMGFDIVHLNLHKTFSTPHGGGGPGSGPIGVKERLIEFLPNPDIVCDHEVYSFADIYKSSIGKVKSYYGNFGMFVRAYIYIRIMGQEGLKKASELAVLNANYMRARLTDHFKNNFDQACKHEFVMAGLKESIPGITTLNIAKRLIDYGVHPPTIYFPLIVNEAMMFEPTETESKDSIDRYVDVLDKIVKECYSEPNKVMDAPTNASVKRINEVLAARKPVLRWEAGDSDV